MSQQQGSISIIVAVIFGLLSVMMSVLWISTASSKSDLDKNFDEKVATEVAVAVQDAQSAKDVEFLELEKMPLRTYTGSATYGSLTFSYPKTWSVYEQESTSGTVLDVYAHPSVVPGLSSRKTYALRVEISSTSYDKEVQRFDSGITRDIIDAEAFRAANVPDSLGLKLTGELENGVEGQMVLLPLRDRTIKIFTESQEFITDFESIILPSITYVP